MRTVTRSLRVCLLAASALAATLLLTASSGHAVVDECLVVFEGVDEGLENGGAITCNDCDPTCDTGAPGTKDNQCVFNLRACAHRLCTPGTAIKKAKVKPKKAGLTATSPCGAFVGVTVKLKKKGKKPGKLTLKATAKAVGSAPKRNDTDKLTLTCNPQPAAECPTTTTTTTVPTTTTTTLPQCGNGSVEAGETCDPPGQAGPCTGGQVCNSTCNGCVTAEPCSCGATQPTGLRFVNEVGAGNCGSVTPARCAQGDAVGLPCTSNADCVDDPMTPTTPGGICIGDLVCAGLYFGGAGVSTPLPATVPDMGVNILKNALGTLCVGSPTNIDLVASQPGDLGATIRSCSSGTAVNTDYPACVGGPTPNKPCRIDGDCGAGGTCTGNQAGCLFGPPLPIPNPGVVATSVCIINRIVQNASGTANCASGDSTVSLPLSSDIYLTGDLLDPAPAGIQPCPLCIASLCQGGPNNGLACTPGSGAIGDAYPTSHDCPPPAPTFIGGLPIPFALSTGAVTDTAVDLGAPAQLNTFCGFCGQAPPGVNFFNPPTPCSSNADCASTVGFPMCRQRTPGAFGNGEARTISTQGSPGGDLTDHLPHDATLAGVFCIPSSFNLLVDGAGDIPGPGAVSLPGKAQLLP